MKIAIIGAGVVGVTTAYQLQQAGAEVTLFDANAQAALETSHANGGQLSYAHIDPIANPAMLTHIPKLLLGRDPAFKVGLSNHWSFLPWSIRFLLACRRSETKKTLMAMSDLALQSAALFDQINQDLALDYDWQPHGKFHLYDNDAEYQAALAMSEVKQSMGIDYMALSMDEVRSQEPALSDFDDGVVGVIASPNDHVGDGLKFTQSLHKHMQDNQLIDTCFNCRISRIEGTSGSDKQVVLIDSNEERYAFDRVVVAAGHESNKLLAPLGDRLPIYPMKGYSLTLPLKQSLNHSISNNRHKHVYTALGDRLRVAGYAQFVGYDDGIKHEYIDKMLHTTQQLLPDLADYDADPQAWAGLRPMTPSGVPIIRQSRSPKVFINSGHGMLGWTLSMGSAHRLARIITEPER